MAGFSQQCSRHSILQPFWLLNSRTRSIPPSLSDFGDFDMDTFFSCYSSEPQHDVAVDVTVFGESCVDNNDGMISSKDREPSVIEKWNTDSSSVVIEPQSGDQVTLEKTQRDKRVRKNDQCKDVTTQGKDKKRKKCKCTNEKKHGEETPTAYIHVRARRGQATDSHSLAERARREKISTKMKQLQGLVPGCDKINSKTLVLDAIINYVQSLQNQVESLSMKLASVNPMSYGFGGDLNDFMKLDSLAFCPNTQSTILPEDATAFVTTTNNCPILEGSDCGSLQQGLGPFVFFQQDDENLLGDVEEQKQIMLINQSFECALTFIREILRKRPKIIPRELKPKLLHLRALVIQATSMVDIC